MKLSIFTTATNPYQRGDIFDEAINCYDELADELVIVGSSNRPIITRQGLKIIQNNWPKEFDWPFIGENFQRGYEACTGDVVIHADLDFIFHQNDFSKIRQACKDMLDTGSPAMHFYKWQFVLPDRYNLKSRIVLAVNKRDYADKIRFDSGGDLCQPSFNGQYIRPEDARSSGIHFYNYEKLLKTKEQIMDDVGRMERAYKRHFGKTQYGSDGTDEVAFKKWYEAQVGKMSKSQELIKLEEHPKYVIETIKNLKPEQFGYNGFNMVEGKIYVS